MFFNKTFIFSPLKMKPSAMSKRKLKESSAESAECISQVSSIFIDYFVFKLWNFSILCRTCHSVFFFLLDLLQRLVQILDTIFRAVNGFYICSVFLSASHLLLASSVAAIT